MTGYLFITGILFLIVGLRALIKPLDAVAVPFGLEVEDVDGRNYLRASAGGVTVACAGIMIAGALDGRLEFAAAVLAVTILGGLLFGRAVSVIADGKPGLAPAVSAFFEALGFASGLYWLL